MERSSRVMGITWEAGQGTCGRLDPEDKPPARPHPRLRLRGSDGGIAPNPRARTCQVNECDAIGRCCCRCRVSRPSDREVDRFVILYIQ